MLFSQGALNDGIRELVVEHHLPFRFTLQLCELPNT
jgi:hypothetical protein